MCVGADSDWRHRLAELRAEPVLLSCRPFQRLGAVAAMRQRQPPLGACGVEDEAVAARARMGKQPYRPCFLADQDLRRLRRPVRTHAEQDDSAADRRNARTEEHKTE